MAHNTFNIDFDLPEVASSAPTKRFFLLKETLKKKNGVLCGDAVLLTYSIR
jgi:hypothetical protein